MSATASSISALFRRPAQPQPGLHAYPLIVANCHGLAEATACVASSAERPWSAAGYWRNPELTEHTFGARVANPSPGTPAAISMRTDDGEQLVRRSTCAGNHRQHEFARLEVSA